MARRYSIVRARNVFGTADPGQAFLDAAMDDQRTVIACVVRVTVVQSNAAARGKRLTPALLAERVQIVPFVEALAAL